MFHSSYKATVLALVILFPWPGGMVHAAAPVPTEFPAVGDLQPPANMPVDARKRWEERKLRQIRPKARSAKPIVFSDLASVPVLQRSFKPLKARVEQLAQAHNSLPARLRSSWIHPADVSKGPLSRCALQCQTPAGVEVDAKLTGLVRAYECPDVDAVILSETLLSKGGMVNLLSAEQVNATMSAGGHPRGVVATRLVRPEDGQEMTMVRWRSGEKMMTLRVAGTQAPSLDFVRKVMESMPD
ncbi:MULTISPECIES: hypothetical protein [unclassified Achromobacter]|uniref:hypothetical protein n=1 Tax=unclassified Achromobacter TaxID=2626865 RepID=UPI0006C6E53F|nr:MULTISPECIES: hypothetical protein [unclassified Achromobacter]CUJ48008.1 Uncharacterised protein [Achromobacter sp. 2789STDY5608621]CUJ96802.1 Uncharacterised protein [Achromobacter sp. 2789STDY5608615]